MIEKIKQYLTPTISPYSAIKILVVATAALFLYTSCSLGSQRNTATQRPARQEVSGLEEITSEEETPSTLGQSRDYYETQKLEGDTSLPGIRAILEYGPQMDPILEFPERSIIEHGWKYDENETQKIEGDTSLPGIRAILDPVPDQMDPMED